MEHKVFIGSKAPRNNASALPPEIISSIPLTDNALAPTVSPTLKISANATTYNIEIGRR